MSKKAPRITALRYAILCILRDAVSPMTVAHIYAAEPEGHNFNSPDNINQAIAPLFEHGFIQRFDAGRGYSYAITEEGRAAIEGLAAPGIDPGHTDTAAADEPEEDEEEIDFALWASGMLQIQVGTDQFAIPPAHVSRLRDYLNEQQRAKESLLTSTGGFFGDLRRATISFAPFVTRPTSTERDERAPGTNTTIAGSAPAAAPNPLPPIDFTLGLDKSTAAVIAEDTLRIDLTKPLSPGNFAYERLGTPAPGTEAIGRPEVNLDGPNGIAGELSHGMTREQQFAETCGRG